MEPRLTDIRLGTLADLAEVRALISAAYGHYPETLGVTPGPLLDDYAAHLTAGRLWLMKDGSGLGIMWAKEDVYHLDNIAIHPDHQGKGIGKLFFAKAEAEAHRLGFDRMQLYTHRLMVDNQAIYRHLGWVETHRVRENGLDRVYMEKLIG